MPDALTERLSYRCDNRWADLSPRGPGRHCAECDTTVIDLSRLTRREALKRTEGGACVRLRLDERGSPIFRTEPTRRGGLVVAAALLGGCAASAESAPEPELRFDSAPALVPVALDPIPEGVDVAGLPDRAAIEADVVAWRYEAGPTPEQVALTEAKQRRRLPVASAVVAQPHTEWMGMMDPFY